MNQVPRGVHGLPNTVLLDTDEAVKLVRLSGLRGGELRSKDDIKVLGEGGNSLWASPVSITELKSGSGVPKSIFSGHSRAFSDFS